MNLKYPVDLHIHSTFSDGTYSPSEIVQMAKKMGFQAIAITDHDNVEGLFEALEAGQECGLEVIPGVEINSIYEDVSTEILGYFVDPSSQELAEALREMRRRREVRNKTILSNLNQAGYQITYDDLLAAAGGGTSAPNGSIGRPHLAKCLIEKGYAKNQQEAFERFLSVGSSFYIPREKFPTSQAIEFILNSGGLPVLPHPLFIRKISLEELLPKLIKLGLCGIEVFYPYEKTRLMKEMSFAELEKTIEGFRKLAKEYNLITTGGSDFHGENKPEIALGEKGVTYHTVQALKDYHKKLSFKQTKICN